MFNKGVSLFLSLMAFAISAQAQLSVIEKAQVARSVNNCESKAKALKGVKWAGLVISSVGVPVGIISMMAGLNSPTGKAPREEMFSSLGLGGAAVGGAAAGYVISFSDDYNELSRLAGELGYGVVGITTESFLARCLTSNSEAECTNTVDVLRKQARNGTMCEWNVFSK